MGIRYGHMKMVIWQNIDKLDCLVQNILKRIPRNEFKLRSQIDSASDSIGSNFVEGYYSGSLAEYLKFLRYGKRSLGELQERTRRSLRKNYTTSDLFNQFDDLSIRTMYLFDRLIYSLEEKLNQNNHKPNGNKWHKRPSKSSLPSKSSFTS